MCQTIPDLFESWCFIRIDVLAEWEPGEEREMLQETVLDDRTDSGLSSSISDQMPQYG